MIEWRRGNSRTTYTLTLKEKPFEDGWLIRIKPGDPVELKSLMTKREYEEFLESSEEGGEDEKEEQT
jgi:glycine cleavage system H protein